MKTTFKTLTAILAIALISLSQPFVAFAADHVNGQSTADIVKELDEYISDVRQTWHIPGMAAAFALDGEVILAKGYGVKEIGGTEPVTEKSIFQIGSVSKSFTASVIASLVDEGKLSWNDTVKNILPDFEMYDPWVTENMQIKDIMTHKSGIAGQVGTYIPNLGYDRDDVYKMLARIKPAYSFRGDFRYNNITFIIAAKIIEKVTGKSWEENVQERIFNPLGMTSSGVNGEFFKDAAEATTPHSYYFYKDSIYVDALHGDDQALWWLTVIGPAGSVCSSVEDMIKYAEFHRQNGLVGDKQVISEEQVKYLHKGQSISSQYDNRITLYGNCWYVEQNDRYRVYFHTGTTWGMTALCFYVPQIKFSGVILVNCEAGENPRYSIMRRAIDMIMGAPVNKYSDEFIDYNSVNFSNWWKDNQEWEAEQEPESETEPKAAPKSELLVGKYAKDELFGGATIFEKDGELYITIGKKGFTNKLNHKDGNTFSFWSDGHEFPINFTLSPNGRKVTGFEVEFNYNEEDYLGGWRKIK